MCKYFTKRKENSHFYVVFIELNFMDILWATDKQITIWFIVCIRSVPINGHLVVTSFSSSLNRVFFQSNLKLQFFRENTEKKYQQLLSFNIILLLFVRLRHNIWLSHTLVDFHVFLKNEQLVEPESVCHVFNEDWNVVLIQSTQIHQVRNL